MRSNRLHHSGRLVRITGVLWLCVLMLSPTGLEAYQIFKSKKKQKQDSTEGFFYADNEEEKEPFRPRFRKPDFTGSLSIFRYLPDENSESSVNFDLGAQAEWNFEKQLYAFVGLKLFFISQNFPVGTERVQGRLANGALLAREHVSTDLSITGLEIPIGLRYRISERPGSLFLGIGLSSRTSLKEKYTDHIDWKMGGSVAGSFVASSTRSTVIRNESEQSFEFFNLFHAGFLSLSKSIHVYGESRGEIQLNYTFHLSNVKNIFQEARFKKFEALGITVKFPLPFKKSAR